MKNKIFLFALIIFAFVAQPLLAQKLLKLDSLRFGDSAAYYETTPFYVKKQAYKEFDYFNITFDFLKYFTDSDTPIIIILL